MASRIWKHLRHVAQDCTETKVLRDCHVKEYLHTTLKSPNEGNLRLMRRQQADSVRGNRLGKSRMTGSNVQHWQTAFL